MRRQLMFMGSIVLCGAMIAGIAPRAAWAQTSASSVVSKFDKDNDQTLDLALVERLFNKADVDHDGTLSVQELHSKAAHTLKRLID
jgi:hypothetical protein